ncbi:MAG TPA: DUF2892 domain-containing protein [Spirochaetales bacterium]|nr:DUF2892 domain-containing protein [Spirochaetales bacterium]
MKKNMGLVDKIIRLLAAAALALLVALGVVDGALAVVFGVVALVFLATSVVGTCPLYLPFGIDTRGTKER